VDKTSIVELETFARRHGQSPEADYARARIEALRQQVAAAPSPSAPPPAPTKPAQPAAAIAPAPPPARCDGVEAPVGNEARCLKPKDSFRHCTNCPEMVVVPATTTNLVVWLTDPNDNAITPPPGSFMMGSNDYDNEKPVHKVTIAKPFAVGKFTVTFAEWDACVTPGGCKHKPKDEGWGRGTRPVINVSWDDATDCYKDSYANAPSDGTAASEVAGCSRVLRGGSWDAIPMFLRSANRYGGTAGIRYNRRGFRVARALNP
jgi:formylglycine-generating enzyme required for sulfatase activity